jgi:hypothetical protein
MRFWQSTPKSLILVAMLLALRLLAPAGSFAAADASAPSIELLHAAINAYDLDLEPSAHLFAEDAVVIQPRLAGLPQIYVGEAQIRWWMRSLATQHVHVSLAAQPDFQYLGNHVRWLDTLSGDAFRELGLESIEVQSDAVLNSDRRIESLTTVFTPQAARSIQLPPGSEPRIQALEPPTFGELSAAAVLLSLGFGGGAATVLFLSRRHPPLSTSTRERLLVS